MKTNVRFYVITDTASLTAAVTILDANGWYWAGTRHPGVVKEFVDYCLGHGSCFLQLYEEGRSRHYRHGVLGDLQTFYPEVYWRGSGLAYGGGHCDGEVTDLLCGELSYNSN